MIAPAVRLLAIGTMLMNWIIGFSVISIALAGALIGLSFLRGAIGPGPRADPQRIAELEADLFGDAPAGRRRRRGCASRDRRAPARADRPPRLSTTTPRRHAVTKEPGKAYCMICGGEVRVPSVDTFRAVYGFIETSGSKNFRVDQHRDELIHRHCLDARKRGLQGQTSLLEV